MKIRRHIVIVISAIIAMMLTVQAQGAEVKSFSDVPESSWAYTAIMNMVDRGMFTGTTTPVNGVGTFEPNGAMTRIQFITTLTRYLYSDELSSMSSTPGKPWYYNNYQIALKYGLILSGEFLEADLNNGCTRQEMAMLMVRAAKLGTGETPKELVPVSRIADYAAVGDYYKDYVRQAYSMGLLTGVDNAGTFLPNDVLNRAQGATVVYRLLDPETRSKVSFSEQGTFTWPNGITYEGEYMNGEANGFGKMVFPKIGTYVGYFVDGKRQGTGTFTWEVGDSYVGNWGNDAMSGSGTYTFSDGYVIQGTWEENNIKVRNFALDTSFVEIAAGTSTQIIALCEPTYITDVITWVSQNETIATVSAEDNLCIIKGKSVGRTKVIATTASGKVCECIVVVNEADVAITQVCLNYGDYTLNAGEYVSLKATISPENTDNKSIVWSSSDTKVADVTSSGLVRGYSKGSAVIYATADNGIVATCYITVREPMADLLAGTWLAYDGNSDGTPESTYYASYTCVFDAKKMSVYLDGYPFYDEISLFQINDYTWYGTYKDYMYTYELIFTSIDETMIIFEVNQIYDSSDYNYAYASYYVLYRQ